MYQLVRFDEKRWGVKRVKMQYGAEPYPYDEYMEPKYKTKWFRAPEVVGSKHEWTSPNYVMEYCMMPEADARKLCNILNKEIQDRLDIDVLFQGATVMPCDIPVGVGHSTPGTVIEVEGHRIVSANVIKVREVLDNE